MKRMTALVGCIIATVLLMAACSSSTPDSPAPGGSSGANTITIQGNAFDTPTSVSPGAEITVKNEDGVDHTVTADTGAAFDVTIPAGESATFNAPDKAGSYAFHCTFHSGMHGTLAVE
jgi:plastocyanin